MPRMQVVRRTEEPERPSTRSAPYLLGLAVTLLGTFALVAAAAASFAALAFVGLVLVVAGALDAAGARGAGATGRFLHDSAGGALSMAAGAAFLASPWLGVPAVTLVFGLYLVASALLRGVGAARSRHAAWGFPVVYAIVAGILGVLVLGSWPAASPLLLGAVAGMEIGARGIVLMAVALELRRADRVTA